MNRLHACFLMTLLAALSLNVLTGCGQDDQAAQQFKQGRYLVTVGQYQQAAVVLEAYLNLYPGGPHASRAGLFLAKAHLGLGQIDDAKRVFEQTAQQYPSSLEAHKCRYKLAMVSLWQGDRDDAIQRLAELAAYPDGPLAAEAKAMHAYLTRVNQEK